MVGGESYVTGGWAPWDTGHYIRIAMNGYGAGDDPGSPAFFPLFPLLMRALTWLPALEPTSSGLAVAAVLIANVYFLAAVPLFAMLAERACGREIALTASALLCLSPFSFFFSAGYTESLFLLLVVGAFLLATDGRWTLASVVAALATATRVSGVALPAALLLTAWTRGESRRELLTIALVSPLGIVAYMAYTWQVLGDPLAFLTAQGDWGGWRARTGHFLKVFLTSPGELLYGNVVLVVVLLNVLMGLLWLASLPWVWRNLDGGLALFTSLLVLVHGATTWNSLRRYLLPAIGFYIAAAALLARPEARGWPRDVAVAVSAMLLTMLTVIFGHGGWVI